ncbi:MAG: SurA N-terminal domain-containing protein [Bacteroidota bacterium]|nr:SurA N-terminal domain-containing protein [Bacteroidota bacterium]
MATLERIRNRAGVLVAVVIGFALLAFILGDMLNSSNSLLRGRKLEIAEINGESVKYPDFQQKVDELADIVKMNTGQNAVDENTMEQLREQTWQNMVREIVMGDVYKKLGIGVSADELFDMVQGKNIHPIVQQLFRDPSTGQVNKSAILQFLKNLDADPTGRQKAYWLYVEKQISQERLFTKYNNLISKGLYVTSLEAKESLKEKNHVVNFKFVRQDVNLISDASIKVEDKDLKAYYDKHKEEFKQGNSRSIDFVTFDILPSAQDQATAQKWINDRKVEFEKTTDNAQFVNLNSDVPFADTYVKKSQVSPMIADWAFSAGAGSIYGPYQEGNAWKIAKINGVKQLSDSVHASHILIRPRSMAEVKLVEARVDSLKKLIQKGASFEKLAAQYSQDQGSAAKGGDLGWIGRGSMVKSFEDACFNTAEGELKVIKTQYGFHLIKVTGKGPSLPHVQLAVVEHAINPSSETYQAIYTKANQFAANYTTKDAFDKAISKEKLNKHSATLQETDRTVNGIPESRVLIRAAFDAKKGKIIMNQESSPIFEMGNTFAIATLTDIKEEGYASFEEVKDRLYPAVRQDKKLDILKDKVGKALAGAHDINQLAASLGTQAFDANDVNFQSFALPNVGIEPAVIGTATNMPLNKLSKPIKGFTGVYVVNVVSANEGNDKDFKSEQVRLNQANGYRASFQAFDVLRKAAKIKDKRSKFY